MTRSSQVVVLDGKTATLNVLPYIQEVGMVSKMPMVGVASDGNSIEVEINDQDEHIQIRFESSGHVYISVPRGPFQGLWLGRIASDNSKLEVLRQVLGLRWPAS